MAFKVCKQEPQLATSDPAAEITPQMQLRSVHGCRPSVQAQTVTQSPEGVGEAELVGEGEGAGAGTGAGAGAGAIA